MPGNGGTSAQGGKIVNATQEDGVTPLTKSDNATVVELVKRVGADTISVKSYTLRNGSMDIV